MILTSRSFPSRWPQPRGLSGLGAANPLKAKYDAAMAKATSLGQQAGELTKQLQTATQKRDALKAKLAALK